MPISAYIAKATQLDVEAVANRLQGCVILSRPGILTPDLARSLTAAHEARSLTARLL